LTPEVNLLNDLSSKYTSSFPSQTQTSKNFTFDQLLKLCCLLLTTSVYKFLILFQAMNDDLAFNDLFLISVVQSFLEVSSHFVANPGFFTQSYLHLYLCLMRLSHIFQTVNCSLTVKLCSFLTILWCITNLHLAFMQSSLCITCHKASKFQLIADYSIDREVSFTTTWLFLQVFNSSLKFLTWVFHFFLPRTCIYPPIMLNLCHIGSQVRTLIFHALQSLICSC